MDQRIDNTYTALQTCMRGMLATATWDEISISALCENAGISRTTFYSHFKNKEELLDSLLQMLEDAMRTDNNGRCLKYNRMFRFLPILLNHVNGNRQLFSLSNKSAGRYPVAKRFEKMINRLVAAEIYEAGEVLNISDLGQQFIAGGIYTALVHWSAKSDRDDTHLSFLNDIDLQITKLL